MPHQHYFYAPNADPDATRITIEGDDAHHAIRVARVRQGDPVTVFDGVGTTWECRVFDFSKTELTVEVETSRKTDRPSPTLTVCIGAPQSDKAVEEFMRRATELSVAKVVIFRAERSQKAPRIRDKWKRVAIEAAKQCGQTWLPGIVVAKDVESVCAEVPAQRFILSIDDDVPPVHIAHADTALLIGPEGDFSPEEYVWAEQHGWTRWSIGPTVFRTEIAATYAAAIVQYEWGRLGDRIGPDEAGGR